MGISILQSLVCGEKIKKESWKLSFFSKPQIDVIANSGLLESNQTQWTDSTTNVLGSGGKRSQLLNTECGTKIVYELYEVKAFFNQRLIELRYEDTLSWKHHMQTVASMVFQQYSPEIVDPIVADLPMAFSLLTNKKSRDLIMILYSKRFLYRLASKLKEKKYGEGKLRKIQMALLASSRKPQQKYVESHIAKGAMTEAKITYDVIEDTAKICYMCKKVGHRAMECHEKETSGMDKMGIEEEKERLISVNLQKGNVAESAKNLFTYISEAMIREKELMKACTNPELLAAIFGNVTNTTTRQT